MGAVKKRTIKICRRLPDGQFLREELREAIRAEGLESEPTVEQYEDRVCDRLGYVPHPNNYNLLMPESDLPEYGVDPDAPAIDRLPYEALDRSERLDGIAIELARDAAARGGTAAMTVKQVHREIFDGNGSANYMRQLMDDVADRPGTSGGTRVAIARSA